MSSRYGRSGKINRQAAGPAVESLESRAYLSSTGTPVLLVTIPGPIPPTAISGEKFTGKIAVSVANDGTGKTSGGYTFTFFASTDATLSSDDSQIYQTKRGLNVGIQKNKTAVFHIPMLPVNLNGSYDILVQVSGAQASAIGASTSKIAITPAHIDLSAGVPAVPTSAALGKKMNVVLTVFNNGNEIAKGPLAIQFADSVSRTGSSPITLGTVKTHIGIKPGLSKVLHLHLPIPLGVLSGNQFIVATVDPLDVFHDSNLANNVSVSLQPVSLH